MTLHEFVTGPVEVTAGLRSVGATPDGELIVLRFERRDGTNFAVAIPYANASGVPTLLSQILSSVAQLRSPAGNA